MLKRTVMRRKSSLLFLFIFTTLLLHPLTLSAHSFGRSLLTNQPVGDYVLSLWADPDPATVGTLHLTVAIADVRTAAPVTALDVKIGLHKNNTHLIEPATHDHAVTKLLYEATMTIPEQGSWQGEITVADNPPLPFILDVGANKGNSLLSFGSLVGGGLALVLILALSFSLYIRKKR